MTKSSKRFTLVWCIDSGTPVPVLLLLHFVWKRVVSCQLLLARAETIRLTRVLRMNSFPLTYYVPNPTSMECQRFRALGGVVYLRQARVGAALDALLSTTLCVQSPVNSQPLEDDERGKEGKKYRPHPPALWVGRVSANKRTGGFY